MAEADIQASFDKLKLEGNTLFQQNKFKEAVSCYSQCIQLCPHNAVGYANRAMAYLKLSQLEDVEKDCTTSLGLEPNNVKVLLRRATGRSSNKQFKQALADANLVLGLEPSNKQALSLVASLKEQLTKEASALEAEKQSRIAREKWLEAKRVQKALAARGPSQMRRVVIEEVND